MDLFQQHLPMLPKSQYAASQEFFGIKARPSHRYLTTLKSLNKTVILLCKMASSIRTWDAGVLGEDCPLSNITVYDLQEFVKTQVDNFGQQLIRDLVMHTQKANLPKSEAKNHSLESGPMLLDGNQARPKADYLMSKSYNWQTKVRQRSFLTFNIAFSYRIEYFALLTSSLTSQSPTKAQAY